jgi:MOSC domain-containing protein YiiM
MEAEQGILQKLLDTLPQVGAVRWIGLRPERRAPLHAVAEVNVTQDHGLIGDRYRRKQGKRQVTLIQQEHLVAVAALLDQASIDPALTRRNIVVSGINLLALKDKQFQIGDVRLAYTGLCHPCSRMEEALGAGGYNAMRGHGGITARVVQDGTIRVGDTVRLI